MKTAYIVIAGLLATAPAAAATQGKICIDPHYSYQAHYLSGHDIVAKATLGNDHRELRLTTTCFNLSSAFQISLSTEFSCIDKGDQVATNTIDGEHQSCRITHVEPYVPATSGEHG
ncbi:MAG TPA: hypothetical protein VII56_09795 [Rhizomicrobium sp.]